MAQADPGAGLKVFVDSSIIDKVDMSCPEYLSRTAFINTLIDLGVADWNERHSARPPRRLRQAPRRSGYADE